MTSPLTPATSSTTPGETLSQLMRPSTLTSLFRDRLAATTTRGIDRLDPEQFSSTLTVSTALIQRKVTEGSYRFSPYLESLRPKAQDKLPRVICIPTVRDRLVLLVLKELLHRVFPECVGRRLPNEFIRRIGELHSSGFQGSYVKCDIKAFYDQIDHRRLLAKLESRLPGSVVRLLERAIRTRAVARHRAGSTSRLRPLSRGVPQGLAISNILAEIYVHEADVALASEVQGYLRYVDDILLFVEPDEVESSRDALEELLAGLGLSLAPEKYYTGAIEDRFEYLGYQMKLPRISVRQVSVSRFADSLAAHFTRYILKTDQRYRADWLDAKAREIIFLDELNERLSGAVSENRRYGWIFYFIEINDQSLLHTLDHVVRELWSRHLRSNAPATLKRLARAYWEARFNQLGSYVHNYNEYRSLASKLQFLVRRGILDPKSQARHKPADIKTMFAQYRARMLARLDADVGVIS